jgi:hypothetical protein
MVAILTFVSLARISVDATLVAVVGVPAKPVIVALARMSIGPVSGSGFQSLRFGGWRPPFFRLLSRIMFMVVFVVLLRRVRSLADRG